MWRGAALHGWQVCSSPFQPTGAEHEARHGPVSSMLRSPREEHDARKPDGRRFTILHVWLSAAPQSDNEGKFQVITDMYRGPLSCEAYAALEAGGWDPADGPDGKAVVFQPAGRGPLLGPVPSLPQSTNLMESAMESLRRCQTERDVPAAAVYVNTLLTLPISTDHITLRVEVVGLIPRIWRQIRVSPLIKLSVFHDQVLCPVLGISRQYHAYAFQKTHEEGERIAGAERPPFLGPTESSALDMAHLPFFIGALGSDAAVKIGSLLRSVGDALQYVSDLGDWWEHRIEVVALKCNKMK